MMVANSVDGVNQINFKEPGEFWLEIHDARQ